MSTPSAPTPKEKPRWELRAFGLSIAIVAGVAGISFLLASLVAPLVAAVGLDGFASFLHAVPVILVFITALVLNGIAAGSDSRGAGLGAWVGFGLVVLIMRGLAAL